MLLIVLTSALGAYFARKQGIEAFQKVQRDLQYGKMPGERLSMVLHSNRRSAAAHSRLLIGSHWGFAAHSGDEKGHQAAL